MKQELIKIAKTTEEAVNLAAAELGVSAADVEVEVLEEAKKGFLGMGAAPAKVKVTYIFKPLEAARSFVETLIKDMGIEATVTIHEDGAGEALITISGEDASTLTKAAELEKDETSGNFLIQMQRFGGMLLRLATHKHTAGTATKENEVPATCQKAGSYVSVTKCSICGVEMSRTTVSVDKLAHTHNYKAVVTQPTCTTQGYTT